MSRTQSPVADIPERVMLSIEDALEKYHDVDLSESGMNALRLTMAHLMGDIKLDANNLKILRQLVGQFLPSAGTSVDVNVNIRAEEYIGKAIDENKDAYLALVEEAQRKSLDLKKNLTSNIFDADYKVIDGTDA